MVAYHYPPCTGSSGVHRTLTFSRYLPAAGFDPVVLSAHPRAFEAAGADQMKDIPPGVPVRRAFALDAARHLAVRGRYLGFTALPDRWASWLLGAVPAGLRLVRRHRPAVLWSTYPIATAHLIGYALHRLTGLPWIADFRDSMTEPHYPPDPRRRRWYRWIERRAVRRAAFSTFTTPGAVRMYRERYPDVPPERFALLPNGYDEAPFADAERDLPRRAAGGLTLVHSGLLYPRERDPRQFFDAVAAVRDSLAGVRIVLRASGHEELHGEEIRRRGIGDLVELAPPVPYREALREMLQADGLLLFQAANCNHQVPAKVYEYFRARRPVFAMTDPRGDTAAVLSGAGVDTIVPLDDAGAIARGLVDFLARVRSGTAPVADDVLRHSREGRARELARLLREAAGIATPRPVAVG
jgi:glycosyltransferase involved in cell wall biosynthesis